MMRHRVVIRTVGLLLVAVMSSVWAQAVVGPVAVPRSGTASEPVDQSAALPEDKDVDEMISRAEEYLQAGQYRPALVLLQVVIDKYAHILYSRNQRNYRSVSDRVEQMILSQPAEVLQVYRLANDGKAQALLSGPGAMRDADTLAEVVRRFFMTSSGDDAAYAAATLALDRHDYATAIALLVKTLEHHPDISVDRVALQQALAVAYALSGQREKSTAIIEQLGGPDSASGRRLVGLLDGLQVRHVEHRQASGHWRMALGNSRRDGYMPTVAGLQSKQSAHWPIIWDYPDKTMKMTPAREMPVIQYHGRERSSETRHDMYRRWVANRWIPSARLQLQDHCIVLKSHSGVECLSAVTGQRLWYRPDRSWYSFSDKRYYLSWSSRSNQPFGIAESLAFNDALGRQAAILDDLVVYIEGQAPLVAREGLRAYGHSSNNDNDPVGNTLTAVSFSGQGKLIWTIGKPQAKLSVRRDGRRQEVANPFCNAKFLGLPVKCGGVYVVPVEERGSDIVLYGLSPDHLKQRNDVDQWIVWRRYLCSYAAGGSVVGMPIDLSVYGRTVYVSTGQGVVAAVDGGTGWIQWATRYASDAERQDTHFGRPSYPGAWSENMSIPVGNLLLVTAPDANRLIAFDRTDGMERWSVPRGDLRYIVGLLGEQLILAGGEEVAAISVVDGATAWRTRPGLATGRAALTADAVLQPIYRNGQHLILKIVPAKGGKLEVELPVTLPDKAPIGNLYTDGGFIFIQNPLRTYGLAELKTELAAVTRRIEQKGLAKDYFYRSGLLLQADRQAEAVSDLRLVRSKTKDDRLLSQADTRLFRLLLSLSDQADGAEVLALLEEAGRLAKTDNQRQQVILLRGLALSRDDRLADAVKALVEAAGTRANSNQLVSWPKTRGMSAQADVIACALLRRLAAKQDAQVKPVMEQLAAKALADARRPGRGSVWQSQIFAELAEVFDGTYAGAEAACYASILMAGRGEYARSQMVLRRLTDSADPVIRRTGGAALAGLAEQAGWRKEAAWRWSQLARSDDGQMLALPLTVPDSELTAGRGRLVSTAAKARARLKALAVDPALMSAMTMGIGQPPWYSNWSQTNRHGEQVLVMEEMDQSQFLLEHILTLDRSDRYMRAWSINDPPEKPKWQMRINSDMIQMRRRSGDQQMAMDMSDDAGQSGMNDGLVMIVLGKNKLEAFGLVNGQPLFKPVTVEQTLGMWDNDHPHRYSRSSSGPMGVPGRPFDIGHGYFVQLFENEEGRLTVAGYSLLSGRLLWQRELSQAIKHVRVVGRTATLEYENGRGLLVLDIRSGMPLREQAISLRGRMVSQPLIRVGDYLVYQRPAGNALVCVDPQSGKVLWTCPLGRVYPRYCGQLSRDYLFATSPRGEMRVIDARTGKKVCKIESAGDIMTLQESALSPDGKTIFAMGTGTEAQWLIATYRLADGQSAGPVIDLGRGARGAQWQMSIQTIARSGRYLPWVVKTNDDLGDGRIVFYDRTTGKPMLDRSIPTWLKTDVIPQMSCAPVMYNRMLIVGSNRYGVAAYRTDSQVPPAPAVGGGSTRPADTGSDIEQPMDEPANESEPARPANPASLR